MGEDVRHAAQWINWRTEHRAGETKPAKVPCDAATGERIDPHDPSRWLPYDLARALDPEHVGFVLTADDPYFCIDLDHAWDGHAWSQVATDTLARFPGAYVEVSYSGDGLHVIGRGTAPQGYSTRGPGVEFYTAARFIAITGTHAQGDPDTDHTAALASWAPLYLRPAGVVVPGGLEWTTGPCEGATPIADDDDLIRKMTGARASAAVAFQGKASAAALWAGDADALADVWPTTTPGEPYDRSSADAALASHLAFWTGRDCERIARLMRRSALARPKWDRADYLARTVMGACAQVQKVYTGVQASEVAVPSAAAMTYDLEFNEDALALRLVQASEGRARYVVPWSSWFIYDGVRWEKDAHLSMYDAARRVCRDLANTAKVDPALTEGERSKIVTRLRANGTVASVVNMARSDRDVIASVDQWDADPWLLNTPGGVIDLTTGVMREHHQGDYMTKCTKVAPGGDCPTWRTFLHRVMDGNTDLIDYLQRLAGYALTGSTREHVMPFAHGSGGNGKGVFVGTISKVMGDYHRSTPIETFAASNTDRHPTELAALRGARLVTAQETEEGRRWAESRIKSLTGGDRIAARFMRQDFFEFDPTFTLLIAGNHKPGLRSVDEAIRRRFHLIPFTVTIPASERDETLGDRLQAEWPGVLAWMIQGALMWQRDGLAPPRAVTAATEAYLDGQDAIGAWLTECCESDAGAWSSTNDLYASFKQWADRAGEFVLPRARFLDSLETRRLQQSRHNNKRGFAGVRIVPLSVQAFPPR
jgi:putative DNA primase/helicase